MPQKIYVGNYIIDIAKKVHNKHGEKFLRKNCIKYFAAQATESLLARENSIYTDEEKYIDKLISITKKELGNKDYSIIFNISLDYMLNDIKQDLDKFGVQFKRWFRESSLYKEQDVEKGINLLRKNGYVFEKDGAVWFQATKFGDDKDRVLIRSNGEYTYFASDIGYHLNKYSRGFDKMIDIFGADHHSYAKRLRDFLKALNLDNEKLEILLVQFASLRRDKEKISMSTRSGEFITLRELREKVGTDVTRFFYIMRKNDQHLEFDLDVAVLNSVENPVYYIQYAYARINSVCKQLHEKSIQYDESVGIRDLHLLDKNEEKNVLKILAKYHEIFEFSAIHYEPHILAAYLRELARSFHSYYDACQFIVDNDELRNARLTLMFSVKYLLKIGFDIIGISCPDKM